MLHDIHFPKIDWPSFRATLKFIKDTQPDGVIIAGDALDFEEVAHHNNGKPLYKPRGSFQKNLSEFDSQVLTAIEKAAPKAERVWIDGNHERFVSDFIETHPEFEGFVDHKKFLRLEERGWEFIPLGHAKTLGHLDVIHGEVLSGIGNQAGAFPSKKALDIYDQSVLAGHTHAPQSFCKISPVNKRNKRMAWIAPILGNTNPGYLRNRPTAWANGFTVVLLRANKDFNCFPVIITEGAFSYGEKTYRG